MPQINIEFDADIVRSLDRIAAKQSIRRTELLRRTVGELIDADGQGRELFAAVVQEITAEDVAHLAREHRELAMELNRVLRANDKREARLLALATELAEVKAAHERDAMVARERGEQEFRELLANELTPFRAEIGGLKNELEAALASQPRLDAIEAELIEVKRLASRPGTQRNLVLGDDRMLAFRFLSAMWVLALFMGGVITLCLTALIPSWGVFVASRALDGDPGTCRFIEYRYGRDDCQVPAAHRIDRTPPKARKARR